MTTDKQTAILTTNAIRNYCLLAITYLALVFLLPANKQAMHDYHLTPLAYHILVFAIVLPSMFVWFAAFYSYAKLRQYARSVASSAEGKDFDRLATGVTWLAWSLPVAAFTSLTVNSIANVYSGFHPAAIIISNYISLLLPLVAFSTIGSASRGLVNHANIRFSVTGARTIVLVFVAAGVFYCYLTFSHFGNGGLASSNNPYYLPIWLMVLTVTIPYLFAWFVGLLAAYETALYGKHVRGLLYRQPMRLLGTGLVLVIASSITSQYLRSIIPRTGHLSLNAILLWINILYLVVIVGYVLLAMGANRLKKIEEV